MESIIEATRRCLATRAEEADSPLSAALEYWCCTCRTDHHPTSAHPLCPDSPTHLHVPIPPSVFMDHRGWRFFYPFYCFTCARRVCPRQFAFSRSCGGCDVSHSRTAVISPFAKKIFAGRHGRLLHPTPSRTDLSSVQIISVDSDEAREMLRAFHDRIRLPQVPFQHPLPKPLLPKSLKKRPSPLVTRGRSAGSGK